MSIADHGKSRQTLAPSILEIESLSVDLGGRQVLDQVSFTLEQGEYVSLVGTNGSGKTTLLKSILRAIHPAQGSITIAGTPLQSLTQRQLGQIVAYVPQTFESFLPMTVREFVVLGRYPYLPFMGATTKKDDSIVARALEITDTLSLANRILNSLSGGERQRVLIAGALAQEPKLLLLDEVCHFLDPRYESDIQTLLTFLNRDERISLISVTHDINQATLRSDRILALRSGNLVFCGSPKDFMNNDCLEKVYGKTFLFAPHPINNLPIIVPETP